MFCSLIAGVVGLVYSIVLTLVRANRSEARRATWEPGPYVFGFALLWPALLALAPFLPVDAWLKSRAEAGRPWAHGLVASFPYRAVTRLLQGAAIAVMIFYVGAVVLGAAP